MFETTKLIRDLRKTGLKVEKCFTRGEKSVADPYGEKCVDYSCWEVQLPHSICAANILKYGLFKPPEIELYITEKSTTIFSIADKYKIKWYLDTKAEILADSIVNRLEDLD